MKQSTIHKKREEHEGALAESLRRVVAAVKERPDVERVILFGSYREGRRDLFTDLDILIVVASDLDFVSRTAQMYQYLSTSVDLDLLVYTPEELEEMRSRPFIRRILEQGEVIYER